jgi:hypothetical protein
MRTSNVPWKRRMSRRLRDAWQLAVMLLGVIAVLAGIGALWYVSDAYIENGFQNCRANGSSYTWCHATIQWQAFKALF